MAATPRLLGPVLLDTDVLSYLLRNRGALAARYRKRLSGYGLAVTFITVGEVYSALYKLELSARLAAFEAMLRQELLLIPYSLDVCRTYGRLVAERTPPGSHRTIAVSDRWIASCAVHYKLPLVTNNVRHFQGVTGLTVMSADS